MYGNPGARQPDVLAAEAGRAGQGSEISIQQPAAVTEAGGHRLARGGVGAEGADGTVYVELGVAAGASAVGLSQVEQLLAMGMKQLLHALYHRGALAPRERPQRRTPGACVIEHRSVVDPLRRGQRQPLFGGRVDQRRGGAGPLMPAGRNVGFQAHHGSLRGAEG